MEYQHKLPPFAHQLAEWEYSRELPTRAIFWEQGTGKSKLAIDTACWLWMRGLINGVLVVAPSGVHRNWIESELLAHLPDNVAPDVRAWAYLSKSAKTKRHQFELRGLLKHPGFAWLAISYDAFVTKDGHSFLGDWLIARRLLYIVDEAHNIKEPTARRTISILNSAKFAPYRRILTGTPVAQGPMDVFTQIQFLDAEFWQRQPHGIGSFVAFRHRFATFRKFWNPTAYNPITKRLGREIEILDSYVRLDELQEIVKGISSRVTKDEVLDLPPKLYQKLYFEMSEEQARMYQSMRDEFMVWLTSPAAVGSEAVPARTPCDVCGGTGEQIVDGMIYPCTQCPPADTEGMTAVVVLEAMTRVLRLQQIACGYLPTPDGLEPVHVIPGKNARVEAVVDFCRNAQHKVIVWSRFKLGITQILERLAEEGIRAVRYDGEVDEVGRAEAVALFTGRRTIFHNGQVVGKEAVPVEEQAHVFVGNPAAGATGITLVEAKNVIYYANSFKLVDRLQSEDRAHRIGQTNQVLYVDMIAPGTVDERIVDSLRSKKDIANQITGDTAKEWI